VARTKNDWPAPYVHASRATDPTSAMLGRGQRVQVLNGRDPKAGQIGHVRKVVNDGGELLVKVAFDDGSTGEYWDNERATHPP
jgi:hypothetical protein